MKKETRRTALFYPRPSASSHARARHARHKKSDGPSVCFFTVPRPWAGVAVVGEDVLALVYFVGSRSSRLTLGALSWACRLLLVSTGRRLISFGYIPCLVGRFMST